MKKQPSIIRKFILIELSVIIILSSWFYLNLITNNFNFIKRELEGAFNKLENKIIEVIHDTEVSFDYIAKLITRSNVLDNNVILKYIKIFDSQFKQNNDLNYATIFWSDKDFNFRVSTNDNIAKYPYIDVSFIDLLPKSISLPWRLHIGPTMISFLNYWNVLPLSFGVTEDNGKYIGSLSAILETKKLKNSMSKIIDKNTSFIILNNVGQLIVESDNINVNSSFLNYIASLTKRGKHLDIHYLSLIKCRKNFMIHEVGNLGLYLVVFTKSHILYQSMSVIFGPNIYYMIALTITFFLLLIYNNITILRPVKDLYKMVVEDSSSVNQSNKFRSLEIDRIFDTIRNIFLQKAEINILNDKLNFLLRRIDAMNDAKTDFIRSIQHELRTPLSHILGSCDILKSEIAGPISSQHVDYVEIINNAGNDLLAKINNIITVADLEIGQVELKEESHNLLYLINIIIKDLSPKIKASKLNLKLNVNQKLPMIFVDVEKMKNALFNIIANSIIFNVENGNVVIEAKMTIGGVSLIIEDTGIGIYPDDLRKITEMFITSTEILTKVKDGLGLGLTIAQSILDLHDIKMSITSSMGVGTKVELLIPNIRLKNKGSKNV